MLPYVQNEKSELRSGNRSVHSDKTGESQLTVYLKLGQMKKVLSALNGQQGRYGPALAGWCSQS